MNRVVLALNRFLFFQSDHVRSCCSAVRRQGEHEFRLVVGRSQI